MSMSINKRYTGIVTVSTALAVVLGAFRIYLLRNFVEPETGYYIPGTNIGTFFAVAMVIAFAVIVAGAICSKVNVPEELSSESAAVVFSSSLCGFLFATVVICGVYELAVSKNMGAFRAVELLVGIPCIFSFFSVCAKEKREKNVKNLVVSLAPALFYAVRTIHEFTDTQTQINSSQRSVMLVMLCAMTLLFVLEAYFLVPDNDKAQDAKEMKKVSVWYSTLTLSVMLLALTAALPYIAVSAFWVFETEFLVMYVLDLCVGVYALTRATTLCRQ